MARYLRRSASIGSSNPVFNFLLKTSYVEESRALPPGRSAVGKAAADWRQESRAFLYRGSIFSSHRISSNHFSVCSTDQSESKLGPRKLEVNAGRGDEGFRKWHNGGGTFHESACIDATAVIEIGAVVHPKAVISANAQIGSGALIGPAVTVGQSTKIGYNVALSNCTIGDSCVIHNGVCIGQDGFGFFLDEHGDMVKKPQLLKVLIGHHVEIGANSCIDRGSWRDTTIGDHTKIDNLVQIAHNAVIGKCCILCGQVGIAGSVTMGDNITLGGRVAVRDHVSIVSKVRLAATSCVTKDIKESGDYGGFPAVPIREWRRQVAIHRRAQK